METDILLKQIGARISARRRELNMTQETLAEKMDVSIQMISNLEGGKKAIRPENLVKLCTALDVSADYILRGMRADYENCEFIKNYGQLTRAQQILLDKIAESWLNQN
jgi:transcriptional regulator with XRE-family HTH domain